MEKLNAKRVIGRIISTVLIVAFVTTCILAWVSLSKYAYNVGYSVYSEGESNLKGTVEITVPKGASSMDIAEILYENKLTPNKLTGYIQLKLSNYKDSIKPGTYKIKRNMKPDEIFQIMSGEDENKDKTDKGK